MKITRKTIRNKDGTIINKTYGFDGSSFMQSNRNTNAFLSSKKIPAIDVNLVVLYELTQDQLNEQKNPEVQLGYMKLSDTLKKYKELDCTNIDNEILEKDRYIQYEKMYLIIYEENIENPYSDSSETYKKILKSNP